jgi:hypothetical protein
VRPSLVSLEIEFLEILNGDSSVNLAPRHLFVQDHLMQLKLLEAVFDEASPVTFVRISPLGEAWLAHYHGRVH